MRLIDADSMIDDLKNQMKTATNPFFAMFCDNCIAHLEKRPTAYNVEAVVARLAEKSWLHVKHLEFYASKICDDAIEIVRNGGKDALRGCGNCKHQPEPLTTCDWMKSQTVVFKECPRWERKE